MTEIQAVSGGSAKGNEHLLSIVRPHLPPPIVAGLPSIPSIPHFGHHMHNHDI